MKKSKFSESQIAFILKQAEDGATIGEVCRKAGIAALANASARIDTIKKTVIFQCLLLDGATQ